MSKNREHFVASMKRKNIKALGAIILREIFGEGDKANELEEASRLTPALIDRTCLETKPVVEEPPAEAPAETPAETKPKGDDGFNDVRKAIKKGKGKKALKLIKAHKDNGSRGSVLTGLKNQALDM